MFNSLLLVVVHMNKFFSDKFWSFVDFKTNQEVKLQKKSGNGRLMFHGGHLKIDKESMHGAKCSFGFNYLQDLIAECSPETKEEYDLDIDIWSSVKW